MKQALSGKRYGASFLPSDNAFSLRGETTRKDFGTQMQVLAAYLAKPGWRPEAFERKKAQFLSIYSVLSSSPMNVASTRYPALVRSGDTRFGLPPIEAVRNATLASGRAEVEASLKTAPLEVLIVGDVTVDEAIAQTAATFGALPKRSGKAPLAAGGDKISFKPSPVPQRIEHAGRPDVALGLVAWHTDDFHDDPAEARAQGVLRSVLQIRAIERIREKLGASYSPQTMQESSEIFDEFGLLGIMAEVNPAEVERLFQTIDAVAEDLKAKPLAPEDLARALRPMIDQLEKERATNSFWATRLTSASWDPRRLETIRTQKAHLEKITPLDIQRLAQKYLTAQRAFKLRVEPGANASSSAPATKLIQKPQ
jgi:zinc protease